MRGVHAVLLTRKSGFRVSAPLRSLKLCISVLGIHEQQLNIHNLVKWIHISQHLPQSKKFECQWKRKSEAKNNLLYSNSFKIYVWFIYTSFFFCCFFFYTIHIYHFNNSKTEDIWIYTYVRVKLTSIFESPVKGHTSYVHHAAMKNLKLSKDFKLVRSYLKHEYFLTYSTCKECIISTETGNMGR